MRIINKIATLNQNIFESIGDGYDALEIIDATTQGGIVEPDFVTLVAAYVLEELQKNQKPARVMVRGTSSWFDVSHIPRFMMPYLSEVLDEDSRSVLKEIGNSIKEMLDDTVKTMEPFKAAALDYLEEYGGTADSDEMEEMESDVSTYIELVDGVIDEARKLYERYRSRGDLSGFSDEKAKKLNAMMYKMGTFIRKNDHPRSQTYAISRMIMDNNLPAYLLGRDYILVNTKKLIKPLAEMKSGKSTPFEALSSVYVGVMTKDSARSSNPKLEAMLTSIKGSVMELQQEVSYRVMNSPGRIIKQAIAMNDALDLGVPESLIKSTRVRKEKVNPMDWTPGFSINGEHIGVTLDQLLSDIAKVR